MRKPHKRCHYCGKRTAKGKLIAFVDGRNRFVCGECYEMQERDIAQEEENARDLD